MKNAYFALLHSWLQLRENHVFHVLHNLRNSVKYCPQNARKDVSRIVVFKIFKIFLWEHASGSLYHGTDI